MTRTLPVTQRDREAAFRVAQQGSWVTQYDFEMALREEFARHRRETLEEALQAVENVGGKDGALYAEAVRSLK